MQRSILYLCFILFMNLSCAKQNQSQLSVLLSQPQTYLSENNQKFTVRYGELADHSLSFIKIILPNGDEKTLPSAVSASGARFTDDRELEWWAHGQTVCLSKRDATTQQWSRCYWQLVPFNK